MTTTEAPVTAVQPDRSATAGRLAVVAGVVGAVLGLLGLVVPPMVPTDQFSAPYTPALATVLAILLCLHHLALVPLVLAIAGIAGRIRLARVGAAIAAVALVGLALAELLSIAAAEQVGETAVTGFVELGYTVPTLLLAVGEILLGVAALRAGRRLGWPRGLPLVAGIYVLIPMIPALAIGGVPTALALSGWSLLYAVLGVAVLRTTR